MHVVKYMVILLTLVFSSSNFFAQDGRPPMESNQDFQRAMQELSNWGRWGEDDELGQANYTRKANSSREACARGYHGFSCSRCSAGRCG